MGTTDGQHAARWYAATYTVVRCHFLHQLGHAANDVGFLQQHSSQTCECWQTDVPDVARRYGMKLKSDLSVLFDRSLAPDRERIFTTYKYSQTHKTWGTPYMAWSTSHIVCILSAMLNGKFLQTDKELHILQRQVGINLRKLRVEKHLTQEQLADIASMSARHIQKIERGELNITLRTIVRLCSALHVEPIKLFSKMEEAST